MRILIINKFLYPKGGDAVCALNTGQLLRSHGHDVYFWGMKHPSNPSYPYNESFIDNVDLNNASGIKKQIDVAGKLLYSCEAKQKMEDWIKKVGTPDIVHLHNFAHQISPSILDVLKREKIPAVMTMHDYKLICAAYTMLSHGNVCEKCAGGNYYHCFLDGCVKESKAKSLLNTVEMYLHHKLWHIYDHIHTFIAPSIFMKNKCGEMGFRKRIVHIPNFINIEDFSPNYNVKERVVVFCGRLSKEKGVETLLDAVKGLDISLKIIGDGPLKDYLMGKAENEQIRNVKFLGYMTGVALKEEIRNSMFMVVPSEWYENNPLSVIEAFALGKPVVGARIGGIPELVLDGETGFTFEPFKADDLRAKILKMFSVGERVSEFGRRARAMVEERHVPDAHYLWLLDIYKNALNDRKRQT